jgi:hypothetical protein
MGYTVSVKNLRTERSLKQDCQDAEVVEKDVRLVSVVQKVRHQQQKIQDLQAHPCYPQSRCASPAMHNGNPENSLKTLLCIVGDAQGL